MEFVPWLMLVLAALLAGVYAIMLKRLGALAGKCGVRDAATIRHYRRYQMVGQIIVVCLLLSVFVPLHLSGFDLRIVRLTPLVIGGVMLWQMYLLQYLSAKLGI